MAGPSRCPCPFEYFMKTVASNVPFTKELCTSNFVTRIPLDTTSDIYGIIDDTITTGAKGIHEVDISLLLKPVLTSLLSNLSSVYFLFAINLNTHHDVITFFSDDFDTRLDVLCWLRAPVCSISMSCHFCFQYHPPVPFMKQVDARQIFWKSRQPLHM